MKHNKNSLLLSATFVPTVLSWWQIGPGAVALFGTANPAIMIGTTLYIVAISTFGSVIPKNDYYGYTNNGQNNVLKEINQKGEIRFPKGTKYIGFKVGEQCKALGIPHMPQWNCRTPQLGETGIYVAGASGPTLSPIVDVSCTASNEEIIRKIHSAAVPERTLYFKRRFTCDTTGYTSQALLGHIWEGVIKIPGVN